jgi:HAD superfamily hydrolase (TIGR01509 family)
MPPTSSPPDLVIFDCDGVLVDSERIFIEHNLTVLPRLGITMTREELVDRFVGRPASVLEDAISAHLGHPLDPALQAEFRQLHVDTIARDLQPVPGIVDALARIDRPTCVASGSTRESIGRKLTKVGLHERFAGRIFSGTEVRNNKPAPDIFLYAAECMGTQPDRCIVVEDSMYGVMAARAAGMRVLAYASGLVPPERLRGESTTLFTDMSQLVCLIYGDPCSGTIT